MAIRDARVVAYTNLFKAQMGALAIAVYQVLPRYQSGKGFSDFLRGLLRRILRIALNVGKSALSAMSDAQEQVASFSDTLKSALRTATKAAIHGAFSQIDKAQKVSGRKRLRKHKTLYKGHKAKRSKAIIYNF